MPTEIDARAVTRLFPEMAKNPAEFFVNVKLQGMTPPDESYAVNPPITAPMGVLFAIFRLLILIVIQISSFQWSRPISASHNIRKANVWDSCLYNNVVITSITYDPP